MNKSAICFTKRGADVIKRITDAAIEKGLDTVSAYVMNEDGNIPDGYVRVKSTLREWTGERFADGNCIIYVGESGIAVRAFAGCLSDKLKDPPVIVIDDNGTFVIPILSGHAGGADRIAATIAGLIGAVPVITTSTDVNGAFSADVFAAENNLRIINREGIKKVSSKAIEGKSITLSIKDYPPSDPVDIIVADETDREYSLLLAPRKYVIGIGLKKGKTSAEIDEFISGVLRDAHIDMSDIYAVCTIDIKEKEQGLKDFCSKYRLPLITFDAPLLNKAPGSFDSSDFVREVTGTDNVCERAAILGSENGEMIVHKTKGDGLTFAVAKRRRYL